MLRNTVLRSLPLILVIMLFLITDGPSLSVGTMMSEGDGFLEVSLLHFAPEMQEPLREDGSYASISSALSWFRQHHIDSYACGEKLMGLPASDDASGGDVFALKIVDSILAEYVCMRATTDGYPWLHRSDASPYLLTTTDRAVPVGYRQVAGWGKVVIAARSGLSVLEGP